MISVEVRNTTKTDGVDFSESCVILLKMRGVVGDLEVT